VLAASVLAGTSSMMGASVEALAGDSLLGGVVEGGGMLEVAPDGSSYCCSSPARTAMLATKIFTPAPASEKWLEYLRWGLRWGLRRELDSEPAGVVSGGPPVVAAGSSSMITIGSLVEILALFAILCAKVSSLGKQARVWQVRKTETNI
jgi:hypothetical protein